MDAIARNFVVAACLVCAVQANAAETDDPKAIAAAIQKDVVAIRGLPFKQPVAMDKQTPEGLGRRMDKEMKHGVPPALANHFDKIVRRLGLYNGPAIGDFRQLMRKVVTSQVAAYYDTDTKRIYLLSEGSNDLEQGVVYSHELYHALQDQYFDLNAFTSEKLKLDSDQDMARQALVEGEATYIHTLWGMRRMMNGASPPRALVGPALSMQANMSFEQMLSMVGNSEDADELDSIPPFILEILVGNYMKGAAFVYAVQEKGWAEVEKLYKEYPPQSTEQILHPEKWVARENPSSITWKDLKKEKALKDWELLDDDVVGEIQWRIIFKVNGMATEANAAAAGWDGDRYAVFKRKKSDETMMLLRTSWDSEAEASEFADAYQRALAVKYTGSKEASRVERRGVDVFIVEGGKETDLDALMGIVTQATKSRP
jgi:hypothetical protein